MDSALGCASLFVSAANEMTSVQGTGMSSVQECVRYSKRAHRPPHVVSYLRGFDALSTLADDCHH